MPAQQQTPFFYQQQNQPQIPGYFPYPPVSGITQPPLQQIAQPPPQHSQQNPPVKVQIVNF